MRPPPHQRERASAPASSTEAIQGTADVDPPQVHPPEKDLTPSNGSNTSKQHAATSEASHLGSSTPAPRTGRNQVARQLARQRALRARTYERSVAWRELKRNIDQLEQQLKPYEAIPSKQRRVIEIVVTGFVLIAIGVGIFAYLFFGAPATPYLAAGGVPAGLAFYFWFFTSFSRRSWVSKRKQQLGELKQEKIYLESSLRRDLGDDFDKVVMADGRQGETAFEQIVSLNIENLHKYLNNFYALAQEHTEKSFSISRLSGIAGFVLILLGLIVGFTSNLSNDNSRLITFISTGSGIITEFIAGVFFYLYNRTVYQLKNYHDSLISVQNVFLALSLVAETREEDDRINLVTQLINYLTVRQQEVSNAKEGGRR